MRRISLSRRSASRHSPLLLSEPTRAQTAALSGQVTSAKEGAMEGVVVSAKKAGSTVTVSVPTDDKGRFSFPASRLEPGQYALAIRAIGYELEGPKTADVVGRTDSEHRHQAGADQESAQADVERRMVRELPRHRREKTKRCSIA